MNMVKHYCLKDFNMDMTKTSQLRHGCLIISIISCCFNSWYFNLADYDEWKYILQLDGCVIACIDDVYRIFLFVCLFGYLFFFTVVLLD